MGGDRAGWLALAGLLGVAAMWPTACVESQTEDDDADAVLADVGPQVVLPALDDYDRSLAALVTEVDRWADTGEVAGARTAWAQAMDRWQVLDVLRVAPSADVDPIALRDETYSWPVVNPCRVDQVTATGEYDDVSTLLVNARGLDALQYLLYADADNACPSQAAPNSDGAWDAIDDLDARRIAYAQAITDDLVANAAAYRAAWTDAQVPELQSVIDGLFVLESEVKDAKLGHPLGIVDCDTFDCAEDAEGRDEVDSIAWIGSNLEGFRDLFTGGGGQGIDDLLAARGAADISDDILTLTDEAIQQADALEGHVGTLVTSDRTDLVALYDTVDAIDELLRVDLTGVLQVQIPSEIGGDND